MKSLIQLAIAAMIIAGSSAMAQKPNGKPQVLIFLASKCPCAYNHQETFKSLVDKYGKEIDFKAVFIDKNDDGEDIKDMLKNLGWSIQYTIDKTRTYIHKYNPEVTTECMLVSSGGEILYRGAVDDSPLNLGQVNNFYLKDAIENYMQHVPIKVKRGKAVGCLINI